MKNILTKKIFLTENKKKKFTTKETKFFVKKTSPKFQKILKIFYSYFFDIISPEKHVYLQTQLTPLTAVIKKIYKRKNLDEKRAK